MGERVKGRKGEGEKGRKDSRVKIVVHLIGRLRELKSRDFEAVFLRALKLIPKMKFPAAFEHSRVSVTVHLVNDAEIAELNAQHMKHEGATDVLSFPMGEFDPESQAFNLGEVILSVETARREAAARKISFKEEMLRYAVHGFLHCMGYEDSTAAKRKGMFKIQERALKF